MIEYNGKVLEYSKDYSKLEDESDIIVGRLYLYLNPLNKEIIIMILRGIEDDMLIFDDYEYITNPSDCQLLRGVCYNKDDIFNFTNKREFYKFL